MITTQAQVDLCNQAFRSLGEQRIALPPDVSNPRWVLALAFYDQTQDTCLTEHFWNFATTRVVLARAAGVTPAWGFAGAFALPGDYLALQRVQTGIEYQREGTYFVSDEETLPLTYTARIVDVTQWPAYFTQYFVAALTATVAEQTTGQQAKHQLWLQLAESRLKRAKVHDGQEGSAPQVVASALIRARQGGWRSGLGWR